MLGSLVSHKWAIKGFKISTTFLYEKIRLHLLILCLLYLVLYSIELGVVIDIFLFWASLCVSFFYISCNYFLIWKKLCYSGRHALKDRLKEVNNDLDFCQGWLNHLSLSDYGLILFSSWFFSLVMSLMISSLGIYSGVSKL